jgi:hypothetical protein
VEPLAEYFDAVAYRRREADPEEERRLTAAFLESVTEQGLVVRPLRAGNAGMVEVFDPEPDRAAAEAQREATAAQTRLDEFREVHREEIAADARRAEMERIRDALAGDDPAAVREALGG